MASAREVFQEVSFDDTSAGLSARYDEDFGFYTFDGKHAHPDERTLLGFGAMFCPEGGYDESTEVTPLVDYDKVPPEHRTIHKLGKGVGPRMYNSPEAALGWLELPETIGAYAFTVNAERIHKIGGNRLTRIGRHATRMVAAHIPQIGLKKVVEHVHKTYGDAQAVRMTQPPRAEIRQKYAEIRRKHNATKHHVTFSDHRPQEMKSEVMILRDRAVVAERIGSYVVPPELRK